MVNQLLPFFVSAACFPCDQNIEIANRLAPKLGDPPRRLTAAAREPEPGPAPTLRQFATGAEETAWIVDEIRGLHRRGIAWEDVAVLHRINGRSESLEQELAKARIPYQVAGAAFLRRPAARAVLSALRRAAGEVVGAVEAAVQRVGYRPGAEASGEEATRQADLGRLLELAREYPGEGGAAGFVADLQRRFASEEDGRGVQLLTYHRAKGKEFDAVFLPRLEDRELPFALAKTPEDRAEERRLLYVGITRSRRHLYLSWAGSREDGPRRRLAPSPFLEEIRPPRASPPPASRPTARTGAGEADPALLKALKEWRRDESRRCGVPAYVIFHDRTLAGIAAACPRSTPELLSVSGVGPAKVANHGEAVLAVVKAHTAPAGGA